jgi:glycerate kinase
MPSVLVAPDSFKGTLTAAEVAAHVTAGLLRACPGLDVAALPVADGGEGTLAAAVAAGFEPVPVTVSGPTGESGDLTECLERPGPLLERLGARIAREQLA